MPKVLKTLEKTIQTTPWYVSLFFIPVSIYNVYTHGEDSLVVICNVIAIACLVYVIFYNWQLRPFREPEE